MPIVAFTPPVTEVGPSTLVSGFLLRSKRATLAIVTDIPAGTIRVVDEVHANVYYIGPWARLTALPDGGFTIEVYNRDTAEWVLQMSYQEVGFTPPMPPTTPSFFYFPDVNDTAGVAAVVTVGLIAGSRMDVIIDGGLRSYLFKTGAADGGDPGQVAPDDYDSGTNDFHWEQML